MNLLCESEELHGELRPRSPDQVWGFTPPVSAGHTRSDGATEILLHLLINVGYFTLFAFTLGSQKLFEDKPYLF